MNKRDTAPRSPARSGVLAYVAATVAMAVVGMLVSYRFVGVPTDEFALATLLALGVLSVRVHERDVGSNITFSFLSIIVISSVVLVGPVGSALVGALSMAVARGSRSVTARVFNAGMLALQGVIGGAVYLSLGGAFDFAGIEGPGALLLRVGLPLMAADAAQMLTNAVLLAGIVRLSSGTPPRRFLVQIISNSGVGYLAYGVIGFLFVVLWIPAELGPFSAVLILAPLYVARWAFVQYGDEQRSHERVLSTLVTAVETKDPYAVGHSARTAQLAEWMAEPLSMGAQEVEALRFAAMLHDVGKVAVPTRILRRRGTLTPDDVAALVRHPQSGVDIVRDIGFLSASLDGIRHHHERWDGSGYPDGLAGEQIPLAARVIAVADAFDALTTPRAERPALTARQALRQIDQRRGRQFDPTVVSALAAVLDRHPWPPRTEDPERLERMRGYVDHDDPLTWERIRVQSVLAQRGAVEPGDRAPGPDGTGPGGTGPGGTGPGGTGPDGTDPDGTGPGGTGLDGSGPRTHTSASQAADGTEVGRVAGPASEPATWQDREQVTSP